MRRGEVWWADVPPPVGRRPVVILTRNSVVNRKVSVVVAQITRTVHGIASEVKLTQSDGMPQECVVNCDNLMTIAKASLVRRISVLQAGRMHEIANAIKFAIDI